MSESWVQNIREIRGVLLPVGDRALVLPNAAVAELIGFQEPEPDADRPDWWLGSMDWRGRRVPVISFARALGQGDGEQGGRARIVVVNTLNGNPRLPHIGLYSSGVSRLTRLTPSTLAEDERDEQASPLIQASVLVNGQPAWIPDIDKLEQMVLEAAGA